MNIIEKKINQKDLNVIFFCLIFFQAFAKKDFNVYNCSIPGMPSFGNTIGNHSHSYSLSQSVRPKKRMKGQNLYPELLVKKDQKLTKVIEVCNFY